MERKLIESAHTISLNLTISDRIVERLSDLGIYEHSRDAAANAYHNEHFETEAHDVGMNPFRLDRKDAQGNLIADSGRLMFGREEAEGDLFTFGQLVEDIGKMGFNLSDVNIVVEQRRNRLFLNFRKEPAQPLHAEAAEGIRQMLNGWWGKLQGFRNPDGRWNMNVRSRVTDERQIAKLGDKRSIRMASNGVFRLISVQSTTASTAQ